MPPEQVNVLIWRGLGDSDGGFPLIGKLYTDSLTGDLYICYKPDANNNGGIILEREFRLCRWAHIPMPDVARKKLEREMAVMRKNGVNKSRESATMRRKMG